MNRLIAEFDKIFDLDHRVRGTRLKDLIVRAIEEVEQHELPEWGTEGPTHQVDSAAGPFVDFYYAPHLFPGMDVLLRLAHKLQFHMLPREVPPDAPLSIAAVLESYCHLSGDLFGWETLEDGGFLIWIVDVSGHGVRAGLASAMLKVLIDSLRQRVHVGSLAMELNDLFHGSLREDKGNLFATGFFLSISADGSAHYVSTGHPPMLLRRRNGEIEEMASNGIPLGMFPGREFKADPLQLESDDTMLLFTDGLVETTNEDGKFFGIDRLRDFMQPEPDTPRSTTHRLFQNVSGYQNMDELDDDVTYVVARMR